MSFDKHTSVKRHLRDGKPVKSHLRRIKKDMKKVVDPTRDHLEIIELYENGIIEIPSEVYNQIICGVKSPLDAIKETGFDDSHLQELFQVNGISETGEVVIRNATSGALKHVQLLDSQE
jgi:hypothetical protein